ncbi:MAG: hypothetical protein OHK0022_36020 [Roseiflexaceae bacterium]
MKRQWKVAGGFLIVAVLVGLGIIPARRAMTVRVAGPKPEPASKRPAARSRRRGLLRNPVVRAVLRRLR